MRFCFTTTQPVEWAGEELLSNDYAGAVIGRFRITNGRGGLLPEDRSDGFDHEITLI